LKGKIHIEFDAMGEKIECQIVHGAAGAKLKTSPASHQQHCSTGELADPQIEWLGSDSDAK
jgi:hypothetical protein